MFTLGISLVIVPEGVAPAYQKHGTEERAGYDVHRTCEVKVRETIDISTLFDLYVHRAFLFSRISAVDVNMYIVMK